MFSLEYAQNRNGRFAAWIDSGGAFNTREQALAFASKRGLKVEGEDFLIGEFDAAAFDEFDGYDERATRNSFDR